MNYLGRTVKIADETGLEIYKAKLVRRDGENYIADLNGFEVIVNRKEVERQMRMPIWAIVLWVVYLALLAAIVYKAIT